MIKKNVKDFTELQRIKFCKKFGDCKNCKAYIYEDEECAFEDLEKYGEKELLVPNSDK